MKPLRLIRSLFCRGFVISTFLLFLYNNNNNNNLILAIYLLSYVYCANELYFYMPAKSDWSIFNVKTS